MVGSRRQGQRVGVGAFALLAVSCAQPGAGPGGGGDAAETGDAATDTFDEGVVGSLGEVRTCPAPLSAPAWTAHGPEWGFAGPVTDDDGHGDGGGATILDYDFDGDLDLASFLARTPGRVYLQEDGGFSTVAELDTTAWTAMSFDLDGDGRRDLAGAGPEWDWLYATDAGWTVRAPLWSQDEPPAEATTLKEFSPGDADGDGDIDLYVVAISSDAASDPAAQQDFVLLRDREGWRRGPSLDPGGAQGSGFSAAWLDANEDGWMDVYVSNDHGVHYRGNVLWLGGPDGFREAGPECYCEIIGDAMGAVAADINRDGHFDLTMSMTLRNILLLGAGDGTFTDVSTYAGMNSLAPPYEMGWGGSVGDLDNDGLDDLLFANGDSWSSLDGNPRVFPGWVDVMIQQPDGTFVQRREEYGFPEGGSYRGTLPFDINDDGVLDVVVTESAAAPTWMISTGCTEANWLAVEAPEGSFVVVEAGEDRWVGRTTADFGFAVSAPPRLHVGLGDHARVDRVKITLPDGRSGSFAGVEARRVVTFAMSAEANPG